MIFRAHLITSFLLMSSQQQVPEQEQERPNPNISVTSYFYNQVEKDRIKRGIAIYYMYQSFKNQCKDLNFSLDFDTNVHKVVLKMDKVVTDRAEYEATKSFIQREVDHDRFETNKFPEVPKEPYIEWVLTSDEFEEEEKKEEEKDDDKKDPDWKP